MIGKAQVPGSNSVLHLYRTRDDYLITVPGRGDLMSTRKYASEAALGRLPCELIANPGAARVLIGGLGMGFTLAAVLKVAGPDAEVTVAEWVPEIIEWNRGELGASSGHPLSDPRTWVHSGDVSDLLRDPDRSFDVIALDVDNGPEGFSSQSNDWLYSPDGIACASERLEPGGVLAYWSATPDTHFARRLRQCGLQVTEKSVFAHGSKGTKNIIWLAMR